MKKKIASHIFGLFALLAIFIATLSTPSQAIAQGRTPTVVPSVLPYTNFPWESFSQMWNTTSATWYYGTITIQSGSGTPVNSQLGVQLDTASAGGVLSLTTSLITSGYVNADTVIASPLPLSGGVTMTAQFLKASATTTTLNVTVMSSSDGINFVPIPGISVYTVVANSTTVPVDIKITINPKVDRYLQLYCNGDGTHAYSAQAQYYWFAAITNSTR